MISANNSQCRDEVVEAKHESTLSSAESDITILNQDNIKSTVQAVQVDSDGTSLKTQNANVVLIEVVTTGLVKLSDTCSRSTPTAQAFTALSNT